MGCASSNTAEPQTTAAHDQIEIALREAAEAEKKHFKILLLGAGESGKSTFCKQLKVLHREADGGGLSEKDKALYSNALKLNVIETMQSLLQSMTHLEPPVQLANDANTECNERVLAATTLSGDVAEDITKLWADTGVQEAWSQRHKFWFLDAMPYYMEHAQRIAASNFIPTDQDIIMSRVVTTGITEVKLKSDSFTYTVVDVGGQRSERRKWIHCFDGVKAIVFVVNLAGYHQVMFEDTERNRMRESLDLFADVMKNPLFSNTPFFVLLNKKDLFLEELKHAPLSCTFPEYDEKLVMSASDEEKGKAAMAFVQASYNAVYGKAMQKNASTSLKKLHVQYMAATSKDEVAEGWQTIRKQVLLEYGQNEGLTASK